MLEWVKPDFSFDRVKICNFVIKEFIAGVGGAVVVVMVGGGEWNIFPK